MPSMFPGFGAAPTNPGQASLRAALAPGQGLAGMTSQGATMGSPAASAIMGQPINYASKGARMRNAGRQAANDQRLSQMNANRVAAVGNRVMSAGGMAPPPMASGMGQGMGGALGQLAPRMMNKGGLVKPVKMGTRAGIPRGKDSSPAPTKRRY